MGSDRKIVPLNSKEATDYLSKLLGMPVYYGNKPEKKEEKKNG